MSWRSELAVPLAASPRVGVISDISFVITVVIVYLVPFYLGYRIATRKGFKISQWVSQVLLFNWLGLLYLTLKAPTEWAPVKTSAEYHAPPREDRRQDILDGSFYGQRRH